MSDINAENIITQNDCFILTLLSVVGDREEQQDSFGYKLDKTDGIVVVCDGMGGHNGGRTASTLTVNKVLELADPRLPTPDEDILKNMAIIADKAVSELTYDDGSPLNAGSTLASVIVKDMCMYWVSVGDSRVYLRRGQEFLKVTNDHNYLLALDEGLRSGEISPSQYSNELVRGEALISYIGLGNVQLIDYSESPLRLCSGDEILIMTDGLYKIVTDAEMQEVMLKSISIENVVHQLESVAANNAAINNVNRDNMTVAVIKIK